jgi:hypothetical protein
VEQRVYRGEVAPGDLADFLVQHFDPQEDLQAQKIGEGESLIVQVGRGDTPKELRHAVTVAITNAKDAPGLAVTLGQQQWLTPTLASYTAMMGLVSALVTPWALFALIWPLSQALGSRTLPEDVWNAIETYMASKGATRAQEQQLTHPHAG